VIITVSKLAFYTIQNIYLGETVICNFGHYLYYRFNCFLFIHKSGFVYTL